MDDLRATVRASRYLLGARVVNDAAARALLNQVDFDRSGEEHCFLLSSLKPYACRPAAADTTCAPQAH
jgi:hypothetical protein